MDKVKQNNKFWFDFFIIFLLGNIIIGFFSLLIKEKIYIDYIIEGNKQWFDIKDRIILIFGPSIISFIGIVYAIISFIVLHRDINIVHNPRWLKIFLICYYILYIFTISWKNYTSPFCFLSNSIYLKIFSNNII